MGKRTSVLLVGTALVGLVGALVACSSGTGETKNACDATVDLTCVPDYEPTFDNVFTNTLKPSCALSGASCHAAAGRKGGLVFEDAETAHRLLVDGRVVPGKPECGALAQRLTSAETSFQMPPGLPLAAGERCAIIQWIARGAAR